MNDWRTFAACLTVPQHYFFAYGEDDKEVAFATCDRCSVRAECYESALTSNRGQREQHGIFGGVDFEDYVKDRLRANQRRSRAKRRIA